MAADVTTIALTVATFRRPAGLAQLLRSVDAQVLPDDVTLRVVIVDNDPNGTAADTAAAYMRSGAFPALYVRCLEPGIAPARNAGLRAAGDCDVFAIVDDDETVAEDWLAEMVNVLSRARADVVTGPVLPVLPRSAPRWVSRGRWFERPRFPTGTLMDNAATNNVIVRRSALERLALPGFDVRYGLSGGSDSELFGRLVEAGARIVWCDTALVHEHVPSSRTTLRWVARRAVRNGNVAGRLMVQRGQRREAARHAGRLARAASRDLIKLAFRREFPADVLRALLTAIGYALASLGLIVNEYGGPLLERDAP